MVENRTKTLAFRVTASLEKRVRDEADAEDIRIADWLRDVVTDHLARMDREKQETGA